MKNKKEKQIKNINKGALLFELLIVISLLAVILSIGANAVFLSIKSNKVSGERDVASALASESLEAVRSVAEEDWQNIYSLNKSNHYFPTASNGKWVLMTGDETVNINTAIYKRYVVISNVSRDSLTRDIQNNYLNVNDDPSTQKVTVRVEWTGGNPIEISEYFFRWKNKTEVQTDWSGGGNGGINPVGTIDTAGGQIKLK